MIKKRAWFILPSLRLYKSKFAIAKKTND